jgi:hypothetical protein
MKNAKREVKASWVKNINCEPSQFEAVLSFGDASLFIIVAILGNPNLGSDRRTKRMTA